jgi:hypothetical protein
MKTNILMLCAIILLLGCRKEKNESPATYLIKNYDSLVVKSYDSIVCYDPPYGEHYCQYFPAENHVSFSIDLDQDNKKDLSLKISHYLYSVSPHSVANIVNVTVESLDTNYRIAETGNLDWPDLIDFKVGDTINSGSTYSEKGSLERTGPYVENFILSGNIHIGFRKGLDPVLYRYGYLNLIVDGAKLTLIRSVLNTSDDHCLVQE